MPNRVMRGVISENGPVLFQSYARLYHLISVQRGISLLEDDWLRLLEKLIRSARRRGLSARMRGQAAFGGAIKKGRHKALPSGLRFREELNRGLSSSGARRQGEVEPEGL